MVIPLYTRAIREGIELAGTKVNFLLASERNLYGDFPFEGGRRIYTDVFVRTLPEPYTNVKWDQTIILPPFHDEFSYSEGIRSFLWNLKISSGLSEDQRSVLDLPPSYDPIVLFTKERTVQHYQNRVHIIPEFLEFLMGLSSEGFGKLLLTDAFHESRHRKRNDQDAVRMLENAGLSNEGLDPVTLAELSVIFDELELVERRPDLRSYVISSLEGTTDPSYVKAYELARSMITQ